MKDRSSINAQWIDFLTSAYVDLPWAAASRWMTGNDKPLNKAGWATYDSAVIIANEAMNQFYSNRVVADIFGGALEAAFMTRYVLEGPAVKATPDGADLSKGANPIGFRVKENQSAVETRSGSFATSSAAYRTVARRRSKAAA